MDDKISASRCKENSIETLVLAPGLPTRQTLSSLGIVEISHRGHFSLPVSSEREWSLGNANEGFSLDQALRKETLWSHSQWVSPPHWQLMKATVRITDGKCITGSDCYSHKDHSGWSRHITCKPNTQSYAWPAGSPDVLFFPSTYQTQHILVN